MNGSWIIRGVQASVRWGYHPAAALGPWTLTASDTGGHIEAQIVSADDYRLSQPALKFCVTRQNGIVATWPVLTLHVAGQTLYASVGPQE
jgi:hypothetical protein